MDLRAYGKDAVFKFPLIANDDTAFVGDYTPAAGDTKFKPPLVASANPAAFILGFDSMSAIPSVGDVLDENGAGTATCVVMHVELISGTVGTTGAGFMFVKSVSGQAWSNDDQIDNTTTGVADIATADSTTYDLAATAGLIAIVGIGLFAAALTATEMSHGGTGTLIIKDATIEDQGLDWQTHGHPSATHPTGGGDATHLLSDTIATRTSATDWDLTVGLTDDGSIPAGSVVIVTDQSDPNQKGVARVLAYDQSDNKRLTLAADPNTNFTTVAGDIVDIHAVSPALADILVATSQMVFTKANEVDVNVKSANGTTMIGAGTSGNKWRA